MSTRAQQSADGRVMRWRTRSVHLGDEAMVCLWLSAEHGARACGLWLRGLTGLGNHTPVRGTQKAVELPRPVLLPDDLLSWHLRHLERQAPTDCGQASGSEDVVIGEGQTAVEGQGAEAKA